MNVSGLLLGVINIAITVAIFLLIGAIILWFCSWMALSVPENVKRGYLIVVGLIGLYMLVALLLGMPTWRIIGFQGGVTSGSVAALSTSAAVHL